VQEKAIAHPTDSRQREITRHEVASVASRCGITLKQTFAKEGKELRRKAGSYAHAKQFKSPRRTVKRLRTILGALMRNAQRGLESTSQGVAGLEPTAQAIVELMLRLERAERIRAQQRHTKNNLYALHASKAECIGRGKARKPYEFGVKVSLAVTHQHGLMVGAVSFPGNPYDGYTPAEQLEQTNTLLQDIGVWPTGWCRLASGCSAWCVQSAKFHAPLEAAKEH
jgi:transposase, IS5 family